MKKTFLLIIPFFFIFSTQSSRAELFNVSATRVSNGQTVSASFDSVQDALNYFKGKNLDSVFGTSVAGEAVNINLNYRGLPASLAYAADNSLTLNIDGIVSNKVFTGANREESVDKLKDFFKSEGGDIINQVNQRLAAVSPADPIAGNPTSLMWQMVENDFESTFVEPLYDTSKRNNKGKRIGSEMGFGIKFGNYSASGITSNLVSLAPFSYRKNLFDSGVKLLLKLPVLTVVSTGQARTYQGSGSIGISIPLYKEIWSITPLASIGAAGSMEQGSASAMRGYGITNKLHVDINNYGISLGTLFGNYTTMPIQINGYKSNSGINNNVLRNSLVIGIPTGALNNYATEFSITNMRYYGTELYINDAMEYGVGLVKHNRGNATNNELRIDLKYFSYNANHAATIGNGSREVSGIAVNLKFQY